MGAERAGAVVLEPAGGRACADAGLRAVAGSVALAGADRCAGGSAVMMLTGGIEADDGK